MCGALANGPEFPVVDQRAGGAVARMLVLDRGWIPLDLRWLLLRIVAVAADGEFDDGELTRLGMRLAAHFLAYSTRLSPHGRDLVAAWRTVLAERSIYSTVGDLAVLRTINALRQDRSVPVGRVLDGLVRRGVVQRRSPGWTFVR